MIRIFLSLVVLCALSCSDIESIDDYGTPDSDTPLKIYASATTTTTKGELVYEPADMGSMGIYCALTGSEVWSETTQFLKMENRCFLVSSDGDWSIYGDPEPWGYTSAYDKYTFFGYSPYDKYSQEDQGITPRIEDGELIIDYAAPSNSIYQPDLMYASPRKNIVAQTVKGVTLNYYHALASISFNVMSTTTDNIITAIEISEIVSEGSLMWDYELNLPTWILGDTTSELFSVDLENYTPVSDTSTQINTEQGYLMMIPQVLSKDAEVTVTLNGDVDNKKTITIPAGTTWVAGSKYSYVILVDELGDADFIFDSTQISNCYIINPTPGENTIVQIPIEERINDFWENYSGKNSTKITDTSTTGDFSVAMVWEDFDGYFTYEYVLLDDNSGKMAVQFTIPAQFQEGNFVFAVQEGEEGDKSTLWSWHLWFTDYNPDAIARVNKNNIEIGVDKAYERSGYEGAVHRYKDVGENVTVWSGIYKDKFIMDRNIGERDEYSSNYGAGAVYYQFGRKDPFPGTAGWYSDTKSSPSVRSLSSAEFYRGVEYSVDIIYSSSSSSSNWCGETAARNSLYIWFDKDITIADYETGKSIFDPSPFGWRVPVSDTWSYLNSVLAASDSESVGKYNYYGCRSPDNNGGLAMAGAVGYVWSANPTNAHSSLGLYYSYLSIVSPHSLYMSYGLPVRAIQE